MCLQRWTEFSDNLSNNTIKRVRYTPLLTLADDLLQGGEETALDRGHRIMEEIEKNFAKVYLVWTPTRDQRIVHEQIKAAVAKYVFGESFYSNELKIKKRYGFDTTKSAIALTAPRRFGKTLALAMVCAVLFMSIPNFEITIVAQGGRSAGGEMGILSKIKNILQTCFSFTNFDTKNKEGLIGLFPDKRQIHAFSAGINNGCVLFLSASVNTVRFILPVCYLFPPLWGFKVKVYVTKRHSASAFAFLELDLTA